MDTMQATKPVVQLTGTDGNVFAVIGAVKRALIEAGLRDEARRFVDASFAAGSYDEVLRLALAYCEVS